MSDLVGNPEDRFFSRRGSIGIIHQKSNYAFDCESCLDRLMHDAVNGCVSKSSVYMYTDEPFSNSLGSAIIIYEIILVLPASVQFDIETIFHIVYEYIILLSGYHKKPPGAVVRSLALYTRGSWFGTGLIQSVR